MKFINFRNLYPFFILPLISIILINLFSFPAIAQESETKKETVTQETLEAVVTEILEENETETQEGSQLYQKLKLLVTKGSIEGQTIIAESGKIQTADIQRYKVGDELVVIKSEVEGESTFYISDYVRRRALLWLFLLFSLVVILVGKIWGITSLLGMIFSFVVIVFFILPQIINGADPIFVTIIGSLIIAPVTFYLSHGFNKKTHVAIASTAIALVVTGILAGIFVEKAKLTGYASEEAGFLQINKGGKINIEGLLLAGIIIGALGILDDVTVSQASVVQQLKEASKQLSSSNLYKRAMRVGQDHVSSMVNTLVLVYTGAALPLLLLFIDNPRPFSEVINYEIIADEIVRTLVGSIGLVLAVPITTFLAIHFLKANNK
jgi:uncharacterized membrane protein